MESRSKQSRRKLLQSSAAFGVAALFGSATRNNAMTTLGPFRTLEELGASLASAGVSASDQRVLLALARPAIALQSKAADDKDIPIGANKIGGAPDLPRDFEWPTRAPTSAGDETLNGIRTVLNQLKDRTFAPGYWTEQQYLDSIARTEAELNAKTKLYASQAPLTFLIQLDLADLAAQGPLDPDFPREGRLQVFYDMIIRPWSTRDGDSLKIIYDTTPRGQLERHTAPDPGYPLVEFSEDDPRDIPFLRNHMPAARIVPVFTFTLPDNHAQPMFSRSHAHGKSVSQEEWNKDAPAHLGASNRFGGWPELIQNDMTIELAARDTGLEIPFTVAGYSAAVERLAPSASQWVLLLQIGDYDNPVWDLNGLYYVWIKREHLKARNFSKAEMIYQTD